MLALQFFSAQFTVKAQLLLFILWLWDFLLLTTCEYTETVIGSTMVNEINIISCIINHCERR